MEDLEHRAGKVLFERTEVSARVEMTGVMLD